MLRFTQHPDLSPDLAQTFCEQHTEIFEEAEFISTNHGQVVKSFQVDDQSFIIKRYPEKGLRANLRSALGISRAMNSFSRSTELTNHGVSSPTHLFVARHLSVLCGTSFLIMKRSQGKSLHSMILEKDEAPITADLLGTIGKLTKRIHAAGLAHGDLHAGNILVLNDQAVEVIDLDNMRPSLKKQEKDRARLLRSFDSLPSLREKLARSLR